MNRILLVLMLVSVISVILFIPVFAQEDENLIPRWIKIIANAWADNEINDFEYIQALKYLIENDIIILDKPQLSQVPIPESEKRRNQSYQSRRKTRTKKSNYLFITKK